MFRSPTFSGVRQVIVPLYLAEEDLAKLIFGDQYAAHWHTIVRQLEREGLPRRSQLMAGLRYVPAVIAFLHRREGLTDTVELIEDGPENWALP